MFFFNFRRYVLKYTTCRYRRLRAVSRQQGLNLVVFLNWRSVHISTMKEYSYPNLLSRYKQIWISLYIHNIVSLRFAKSSYQKWRVSGFDNIQEVIVPVRIITTELNFKKPTKIILDITYRFRWSHKALKTVNALLSNYCFAGINCLEGYSSPPSAVAQCNLSSNCVRIIDCRNRQFKSLPNIIKI